MNASIKQNKRFHAEVCEIGQTLRSAKAGELKDRMDDLRERAISDPANLQSLIAPVIAASNEAIRRVLGYDLYDVQMQAARALIAGHVAEMHTGEGKTISALPAAVFGGIQGKGVHVATTTAYLAERDHAQLKPVYELLGLSAGVLEQPDAGACDHRVAYDCDVTYGTGSDFGFDYLRDQVELKNQMDARLGSAALARITQRNKVPRHLTMMRGQNYSIIDEADNVMVDDASSPLVLSMFQPGRSERLRRGAVGSTGCRSAVVRRTFYGVKSTECAFDGSWSAIRTSQRAFYSCQAVVAALDDLCGNGTSRVAPISSGRRLCGA